MAPRCYAEVAPKAGSDHQLYDALAPLPSGQIVYDPRGTVTSEPKPLAPRFDTLDGLRLGVLDNSKWNASKLLRGTVALLAADTSFAEVHVYKKTSFSRPAEPELVDRIAAETDAVVTAIGD